MRKTRHNNGSSKRTVKSSTAPKEESVAPPKADSLDEDDQGFGGWLRSTDGMENMKLFVIANTIFLLTTLAYPHMQLMFEIISEAFYGPDAI